MKQQNETLTRMKALSKKKRKEERWIRCRMWFYTIMAALYHDRGSIPANIGNNVMIGNNVYITKNALTAVIVIGEMSTDTPVAFTSDLTRVVKNKVPNIIVDFSFKNQSKQFDLKGGDMVYRKSNWSKVLDSPIAPDKSKRRAARLLYTWDIANSGEQMYRTNLYMMLRAENGATLNQAMAQACSYLAGIGAVYKVIKSDMRTHLDLALLMSNVRKSVHKDLPTITMSRQTLAESLPDTQGINSENGTFMGIDIKMYGPYLIDFRATAKAKNIVVSAPAGDGKTFLVQNWFLDMRTTGYNLCVMDVKGTEFTGFTRAVGGVILSMSPKSTYYVNTWHLDKEEAVDSFIYFDERVTLCKETMMLLADLPESLRSIGEALTEEFIQSLYLQLGVTSENVNTWVRTEKLDPYYAFEEFERFCSNEIRRKYADVVDRMLTRLRIYMGRQGSNSHMFRDALNYKDILDTKVLTFDFGELSDGATVDPAMFKVKVLYMQLLNEQFIANKYRKGEWTCKVLEESGIAPDYLMRLYAKDFMLRRSQNQVTVLLGNSVSSLATNPNAKGIIENTNILVLGSLGKASRDYLSEEFGLSKEYEELESLSKNQDYEHTFILINRMDRNATTALLKAFVPKKVVDGKLFRIVDTEVEE